MLQPAAQSLSKSELRVHGPKPGVMLSEALDLSPERFNAELGHVLGSQLVVQVARHDPLSRHRKFLWVGLGRGRVLSPWSETPTF